MKSINTTIRNANEMDIESIFHLWVESMKFHEELDPVIFGFIPEKIKEGKKFITEQFRKESSIILVAEQEKKVIGYLLGEIRDRLPFHRLKKIGYILDIVIVEHERNKGIGSLLLGKAFEFFKNNGLDTTMLTVSERNTNALQFYEKHKFETYLRYMVKRKL